MKHVFVFDPKAFSGQQWRIDVILDTIGQFFRTQGKMDFSIHLSRYRRNALALIQEEVEKSSPGDIIRVYAVGGDEILFDCVNAVTYYPNLQIAAVPFAEPCDFLHVFGENVTEFFLDIPTIVKGEPLVTDVIRWEVNYALNFCNIGITSSISRQRKELKNRLSKGSFLFASKIMFFFGFIARAFDASIARREYQITIDDKDFSGRYSLIHIANGSYYNGRMTGASDATPDDGLLDIALIKSSNPFGTMISVNKFLRGKRSRNCTIVQAKQITVQSKNNMCIQLDNEFIKNTKISIGLVTHALNFITVKDLSYPLASISAV